MYSFATNYFFLVNDVTALMTVTKCPTFTEEIDWFRENILNTFLLAGVERGCPRAPSDIGVSVPYFTKVDDLIPFLVDIRWDNRLIEKWNDIIILYDTTVGKIFILYQKYYK